MALPYSVTSDYAYLFSLAMEPGSIVFVSINSAVL